MTKSRNSSYRQRGSVAVAVALSLVVLVGFLGVVVDLGRMYVVKTELQNAADACALSAAQQLDSNALDAGPLTHAVEAGIAVGKLNLENFQSAPVSVTADDIKFSTTLSGTYTTQAGGADVKSTYVMCTVTHPSLQMSLTSIIGAGARTIAAQAVATLAPAQSSCAIPLGVCEKGPADSNDGYGLTKGQWVSGRFDTSTNLTGSFNWIDFTKGPTDGGNGSQELEKLLEGNGVCNTNAIDTKVGQTGNLQNLEVGWNSRFILYKPGSGNPQPDTALPDYTGYAYTNSAYMSLEHPEYQSWPSGSNALPDFLQKRADRKAYQTDQGSGLKIDNQYSTPTPLPPGSNRRLVVAPIVNCQGWVSAQKVPIDSYGCMLMLSPIDSPDAVVMEFEGLTKDASSPCSTSGFAGGSFGPQIPVLVQ